MINHFEVVEMVRTSCHDVVGYRSRGTTCLVGGWVVCKVGIGGCVRGVEGWDRCVGGLCGRPG